jgi:hypothetical protein
LREVGFSIANGTEYPESGVAGLDPIMHYLLAGADRGYRPHLLFDPAWYMKARGTRQRDQNPLIDYISYGAREGIHPSPYFAPISRRHKRDRSLSARCRDAIHVLARDRPSELRKQCFAGTQNHRRSRIRAQASPRFCVKTVRRRSPF